jgi:hypothetical protein
VLEDASIVCQSMKVIAAGAPPTASSITAELIPLCSNTL